MSKMNAISDPLDRLREPPLHQGDELPEVVQNRLQSAFPEGVDLFFGADPHQLDAAPIRGEGPASDHSETPSPAHHWQTHHRRPSGKCPCRCYVHWCRWHDDHVLERRRSLFFSLRRENAGDTDSALKGGASYQNKKAAAPVLQSEQGAAAFTCHAHVARLSRHAEADGRNRALRMRIC